GLVTALLTAFYMSRQVFLVFFGEARWGAAHPSEEGVPDPEADNTELDEAQDDREPERADVHPHESPWTMTVPLLVLAGLAAVAGFVNLPFSDDTKILEHWLEPVVHDSEAHLTLSGGELWLLAVVATVVALVGIGAAV